jgi:uncharacterized NAD(P)/FAD-binding protein YdhS
MDRRSDRPVVAIVGGGFSGVMTAIHLLRKPYGPLVRLIERRERFGLGTAYSTRSGNHLLNVRARNMSALPDDPAHFTDWLSRAGQGGGAGDFVTRTGYGHYLQDLLRSAIERVEAGRLLLEADAAVSIARDRSRWRIDMAMGRSFRADAIVLAVGNLPPRIPPGLECKDDEERSYFVRDPWQADYSDLPEEGTVLLLGSGLTAVDVVLDIAARRPRLHQLALSRHGLLPRPHGPDVQPLPLTHKPKGGPLALLQWVRDQSGGQDWRSVIDSMRPSVQAIWSEWPIAERRRFLRHLASWWGVHRHRLAPEVGNRLACLIADNTVEVAAGRLIRIEERAGSVTAIWRSCGSPRERVTEVIKLINCTGQNEKLA